jgi:hypothetical protein
MDASLRPRAEQLAGEIASQARTAEDLNGLMRLMMKSALERMLNTEMDVHLGRRAGAVAQEPLIDASVATDAKPASKPIPAKETDVIGSGTDAFSGAKLVTTILSPTVAKGVSSK